MALTRTRVALAVGISVIWIAGIIVLSWQSIHHAFVRAQDLQAVSQFTPLLPMACQGARGKGGIDYSHDDDPMTAVCWYEPKSFRRWYPEVASVPPGDLLELLYARAGLPFVKPPRPWLEIAVASIVALAVPFALAGIAMIRSRNS